MISFTLVPGYNFSRVSTAAAAVQFATNRFQTKQEANNEPILVRTHAYIYYEQRCAHQFRRLSREHPADTRGSTARRAISTRGRALAKTSDILAYLSSPRSEDRID